MSTSSKLTELQGNIKNGRQLNFFRMDCIGSLIIEKNAIRLAVSILSTKINDINSKRKVYFVREDSFPISSTLCQISPLT